MKKLLFIGGGVVFLFIVLWAVQNFGQKQQLAENNLYDKDDLHSETIDQLDDENYQNVIMPDALEKKLSEEASAIVYFFSPTCPHCKVATPKLMEAAKKEDAHIDQYNVYEYEQGWVDYNIQSTPTLIYFKDGKEVNRLEGDKDVEAFQTFLRDLE